MSERERKRAMSDVERKRVSDRETEGERKRESDVYI